MINYKKYIEIINKKVERKFFRERVRIRETDRHKQTDWNIENVK